MKKLSCVCFGLAVLLSDVMCWVVGYRYSDMLWPGPLCGSHLPALSGRVALGPYFSRSKPLLQAL